MTLIGHHHVEHVMGMPISIDIRDDPPDGAALVDAVVEWFHWVDATFSTYKPDSVVSRLAAGELARAEAPVVVQEVLALCDELWAETDGYFDASSGGRLDPSGVVKGWAVDAASDMLLAGGSANHCVNAGGDVRTRGHPEGDQLWQVGIAHPHVYDALCAVVAIGDGAVATSGTAERGLHVLDPHTGLAAVDLASVTVVGPDLTRSDAYATAALAMGMDAPEWLARLPGHEAVVVDAGGHMWSKRLG